MATIRTKRVYEPFAKTDGHRVLVDRLWPRGISKEKAHVDVWLKEVAPSTELRKWYHANLDEWTQFKKRYRAELKANPSPLKALEELAAAHQTITLLYASTNTTRNHATMLGELLSR